MTEKNILLCGHGSGTPSLKEMGCYLESRYNSFASNGVRKGLIAVRRKPGMSKDSPKKFHDTYKTILGRNVYSQMLRAYVYKKYHDGKFYSDCSSSGCFTFKQFESCDDLNTEGMYRCWDDVPVAIFRGHIINLDILQPGDALLFAGNDPSRPKQIGHVEFIYQMDEGDLKSIPVSAVLTVTSSALNVRSGPSTSYGVIGTFKKGDRVSVTRKSGDWFFIDNTGWISRKYTVGWVYEDCKWWYIENGSYPMYCIKKIDGSNYAFDEDGWMITSDRIGSSGAIS